MIYKLYILKGETNQNSIKKGKYYDEMEFRRRNGYFKFEEKFLLEMFKVLVNKFMK